MVSGQWSVVSGQWSVVSAAMRAGRWCGLVRRYFFSPTLRCHPDRRQRCLPPERELLAAELITRRASEEPCRPRGTRFLISRPPPRRAGLSSIVSLPRGWIIRTAGVPAYACALTTSLRPGTSPAPFRRSGFPACRHRSCTWWWPSTRTGMPAPARRRGACTPSESWLRA